MKIRLLLGVVVMLCGTGLASAQSLSAGEVAAGVKGGLNAANLSESLEGTGAGTSVSYDLRKGLIFGAFIRKAVSDTFAIQPEILFSQQGASQSDFMDDYGVKLGYIQVPVLGVVTFAGDSARPFVFAGPALSLKTSAKFSENGVNTDIDDVAGSDVSLVLGAGIEIAQGSIEVRYSFGFKDINPDTDFSAKNRVLSVLVGYRFR